MKIRLPSFRSRVQVQVHNECTAALFFILHLFFLPPSFRFACSVLRCVHFHFHARTSYALWPVVARMCANVGLFLNMNTIFTIFDGNFRWLNEMHDLLLDSNFNYMQCDVTKCTIHFKFCYEFWCDCNALHMHHHSIDTVWSFSVYIIVPTYRLRALKTTPNHRRANQYIAMQLTLLNERLNQFCITLISIWSRLKLMDFKRWIESLDTP